MWCSTDLLTAQPDRVNPSPNEPRDVQPHGFNIEEHRLHALLGHGALKRVANLWAGIDMYRLAS